MALLLPNRFGGLRAVRWILLLSGLLMDLPLPAGYRDAWFWGRNAYWPEDVAGSHSGMARDDSILMPTRLDPPVVKILGIGSSTIRLNLGGTVLTAGENSSGELGIAGPDARSDFGPVEIPERVVDIGAIGGTRFALSATGRVYSWGYRGYLGRELPEGMTHDPTPRQIPNLSGVTRLEARGSLVMVLLEDGTVRLWGGGYHNENLQGDLNPTEVPNNPGFTGIAEIAGGEDSYGFVLRDDGILLGWGKNYYSNLGNGGSERAPGGFPVAPVITLPGKSELDGVVALACGGAHSIALREDGSVWTWGANWDGQLGIGDWHQREHATAVELPDAAGRIVAVAATARASFLLDDGGTVWGAGSTANGVLGDRDLPDERSLTFIAVRGLPPLENIRADRAHLVGLTAGQRYQDFRDEWFSPIEQGTPGMSGPGDDPDRDGIDNLTEYATGRNPRVAEYGALIQAVAASHAGRMAYAWEERLVADDLQLRMMQSSDLKTWIPLVPVLERTAGEGRALTRIVEIDVAAMSQLYLRLVSDPDP